MASSRKTGHLGLNQWDGEDRSEREDFNTDNRLVDGAAEALEGALELAEQTARSAAQQAGQVGEALSSHAADGSLHLAAGEKERLLGVEQIGGSYTGNGESQRAVELGFRPSFGLVWCADMSATSYNAGSTLVYADTLYGGAASVCCETSASGFLVRQSASASDGFMARLNEAGKQYLYVVWRS